VSPARLGRQLWIFLAVLGCLVLGAWLAGRSGSEASAWVGVLGTVVAVVGHSLLNRRTRARAWLLVASAGIAIAMLGVVLLEPSLVLAINGRAVTAMVTQIGGYSGGKGQHYTTYSLSHLDGTPIRGQLDPPYYDTYTVGEHVTVLEDPSGNVDPGLPGDLSIVPWSIVSGVGLLTLLISLLVIGRAGQGADTFWPAVLELYGLRRQRPARRDDPGAHKG
jgi:hypothetical protein